MARSTRACDTASARRTENDQGTRARLFAANGERPGSCGDAWCQCKGETTRAPPAGRHGRQRWLRKLRPLTVFLGSRTCLRVNQRCRPCRPAYSCSYRFSASPSALREIPEGCRSGESRRGGAILRGRVRPATNLARLRYNEYLRTFERDEVLWPETHSQMPSEHDSTIGLARGQSQPEGRV
jgi:hypothetical protein